MMKYWENEQSRLYLGDCVDILKELPSQSIDAVISDPPYPEISRKYGRLTESQWHQLMREVVSETRRLLKPQGSAVFILQPNSEKVGRLRPWLFEFMAEQANSWNLIQDVWWWNTCSLPNAGAGSYGLLRPSLKACVWLGEPDCYRNQSAVLLKESKQNASRRATEKDVRVTVENRNLNGKRCRDAAKRRGGTTPFNVLAIGGAGKKNLGHCATTPNKLTEWWVKYISKAGDTILDPFNGSGTTGVIANKHNRHYIGIEKEKEYLDITIERLK